MITTHTFYASWYVQPHLVWHCSAPVLEFQWPFLQLTPMTPRHRCRTPTDATVVMVTHRLLSSAIRSNDDNDWPVHSLMLSFHDLRGLFQRRLSSSVPYSMTWPNHDNLRRLTIDNKSSECLAKIWTYSLVLSAERIAPKICVSPKNKRPVNEASNLSFPEGCVFTLVSLLVGIKLAGQS